MIRRVRMARKRLDWVEGCDGKTVKGKIRLMLGRGGSVDSVHGADTLRAAIDAARGKP
jgi:hypothetical protein